MNGSLSLHNVGLHSNGVSMLNQADLPPPLDCTSLLSDPLLLRILSLIPSSRYLDTSLVCRRWCRLQGQLRQSLALIDWSFLSSGRIFRRFPCLTEIDLTRACVKTPRNSGIFLSSCILIHVGATPLGTAPLFVPEEQFVPPGMVNYGLGLISENFPNLRRVAVIGPTEDGVSSVFNNCDTLQEIELHCCDDFCLKGIAKCKNLQVVKLVGKVEGLYHSLISDIGLTILANQCSRLVKLELRGCDGSYDGVKAIGQCCVMLEELCLWDHRMDGGWLAGLSFCSNLKTLKLISCKSIDSSPGLEEHLGECPALEELRLEMCRVKGNGHGIMSLFLVCRDVRDVVVKDCCGLDDETFGFARICRRVKHLTLEGCSLLTTSGLETVVLNWAELEALQVISCNNIKDSEVSPELACVFSGLKELRWRPDSKSLLASGLVDIGFMNKGGRFFKG